MIIARLDLIVQRAIKLLANVQIMVGEIEEYLKAEMLGLSVDEIVYTEKYT